MACHEREPSGVPPPTPCDWWSWESGEVSEGGRSVGVCVSPSRDNVRRSEIHQLLKSNGKYVWGGLQTPQAVCVCVCVCVVCVCVCVCVSESYNSHPYPYPHVFSHHSSNTWCVQEPVVHTLVPECDTANVFSTIHIPCSDTHAQFLWYCVFTPSLNQRLLEVQRNWRRTGSEYWTPQLQNSPTYMLT